MKFHTRSTPESDMVKPQSERPAKPDGCPLFPHAGGTWCKKIDGRQVHFGPWSDLKGALKAYAKSQGYATHQPAPVAIPKGLNPVLELLHDAYLTHQHARAVAGDITLRSFRDIKRAVESFCGSAGWDTRYAELTPDHFDAYAKNIGRFGAHAFNRTLTLIKQMFRWGVKSQIIPHLPPYAASFDKIPERAKRRQAAEKEARTGSRTFTTAELRSILASAPVHLKAMILLGLNCGFGNTDVSQLPFSVMDLEGGTITFPRPKTGVARRATLWPETIAAIKDWLVLRKDIKHAPENAHYVFLTRFGSQFVREASEMKGGVIQSVGVVDSVGFLFKKLLDSLDPVDPETKERKGTLCRGGRGFYALRHTFRTWAEETGKQHPILRIMGHPLPGMSAKYVHHISDSQLAEVTDYVRLKVFPRAARPKRIKGTRPGKSTGTGS